MELFVLEAGNPAGRRGGELGSPPRKLDAGVSRTVRARTRAIAAAALLGLASVAAPVRAADVDVTAGVLSYTTLGTSVANALTISLAGGTYTIDDPADPAITLSGNALGRGCAPLDSNTVTCPAAAITSFNIATGFGIDTIVLTGAAHPAVVSGGDGNDTFIGGAAGDTFVWNPGDDDDVVDGGPGDDTLLFNGANIGEQFTITADGAGFDLFRNIANVRMEVENAEELVLSTFGGDDEVSTTGLLNTTQILTAAPGALPDILRVDAAGLCLTRVNDTVEVEGRQPIHFTSFPAVFVSNAFCRDDPCVGAVATQGCRVNGVLNQPCQGTAGDDVIVGTTAGDVILGGGGRDRIKAGSGDDLVCGEEGDDTLTGASGNDTLAGGPGVDLLKDSGGADTLLGGDDNDDLQGGSDNDDLDGGAGDDRLRGGSDLDTLRGGTGVDRLDGGGDQDTCTDADQVGPFIRCELVPTTPGTTTTSTTTTSTTSSTIFM
jgi:Ca2+-binding RTX toxin-like protein